MKKALISALLLFLVCGAHGQVTDSNTVDVSLQATLPESLTLTLNSGGIQTIASLSPGALNAFPSPVNVTTSWVLKPGRTSVALYAYFDSATSALVHQDPANSVDIPAGAVRVQINAGAFQPLTNSVPFGAANAGLQLFNVAITGANRNVSRTDNLNLELDLSSNVNGQDMTQLPADTYMGTLHIRAQATL
ncbi:MAG TPA: hypothetical protein VEB03_00805 [Candidatus Nanoarchaeia archaeon]|nr:hypothetical protein [Candidatus Nanoarchaeia archaeon]